MSSGAARVGSVDGSSTAVTARVLAVARDLVVAVVEAPRARAGARRAAGFRVVEREDVALAVRDGPGSSMAAEVARRWVVPARVPVAVVAATAFDTAVDLPDVERVPVGRVPVVDLVERRAAGSTFVAPRVARLAGVFAAAGFAVAGFAAAGSAVAGFAGVFAVAGFAGAFAVAGFAGAFAVAGFAGAFAVAGFAGAFDAVAPGPAPAAVSSISGAERSVALRRGRGGTRRVFPMPPPDRPRTRGPASAEEQRAGTAVVEHVVSVSAAPR